MQVMETSILRNLSVQRVMHDIPFEWQDLQVTQSKFSVIV